MRREIIKLPVRIVIVIIIIILTIFSIVILINTKELRNYAEASITTEIPLTQITKYNNYGYLRGTVFFNESNYINSSARLIGDNTFKDIWRSNGPIVDFDTIPYEYTLDDLEMPFYLYKRKNSDTIHVTKDGYNLMFLLGEH